MDTLKEAQGKAFEWNAGRDSKPRVYTGMGLRQYDLVQNECTGNYYIYENGVNEKYGEFDAADVLTNAAVFAVATSYDITAVADLSYDTSIDVTIEVDGIPAVTLTVAKGYVASSIRYELRSDVDGYYSLYDTFTDSTYGEFKVAEVSTSQTLFDAALSSNIMVDNSNDSVSVKVAILVSGVGSGILTVTKDFVNDKRWSFQEDIDGYVSLYDNDNALAYGEVFSAWDYENPLFFDTLKKANITTVDITGIATFVTLTIRVPGFTPKTITVDKDFVNNKRFELVNNAGVFSIFDTDDSTTYGEIDAAWVSGAGSTIMAIATTELIFSVDITNIGNDIAISFRNAEGTIMGNTTVTKGFVN